MRPPSELDPAAAWAPYRPDAAAPWDRRRAAHLFRRAAFGTPPARLREAAAADPQDVVTALLAERPGEAHAREMSRLAGVLVADDNPKNLAAWWLYGMMTTPAPLQERMTLFWHGHFATAAAKVGRAKAMLAQHDLLAAHARGDFRALVWGISRDPAMLVYLDAASNRKTRPNENYARELMELFCLGVHHYTEIDVRELARCFTGWELQNGAVRFFGNWHDNGVKRLLGREGAFSAEEAVGLVLDHPACPRFLARKLIRAFICDDSDLPDALVEPLATRLRDSNLRVEPALDLLLRSRWFHSDDSLGRKVRGPVDLAIGLLRALEARTGATALAEALRPLGQALFDPPSVKGWDGGLAWINTGTLLGRANLVGDLLARKETRFAAGSLESWASAAGAESPDAVVDLLLDTLVALPPPPAVREDLVALAAARRRDRRPVVSAVLQALAGQPEFQLA